MVIISLEFMKIKYETSYQERRRERPNDVSATYMYCKVLIPSKATLKDEETVNEIFLSSLRGFFYKKGR